MLHARNLKACAEFYAKDFGLKMLRRTELMLVLGCGNNHVLISNPDLSRQSIKRVSNPTIAETMAIRVHRSFFARYWEGLTGASFFPEEQLELRLQKGH